MLTDHHLSVLDLIPFTQYSLRKFIREFDFSLTAPEPFESETDVIDIKDSRQDKESVVESSNRPQAQVQV
jgi:hypothetical protein